MTRIVVEPDDLKHQSRLIGSVSQTLRAIASDIAGIGSMAGEHSGQFGPYVRSMASAGSGSANGASSTAAGHATDLENIGIRFESVDQEGSSGFEILTPGFPTLAGAYVSTATANTFSLLALIQFLVTGQIGTGLAFLFAGALFGRFQWKGALIQSTRTAIKPPSPVDVSTKGATQKFSVPRLPVEKTTEEEESVKQDLDPDSPLKISPEINLNPDPKEKKTWVEWCAAYARNIREQTGSSINKPSTGEAEGWITDYNLSPFNTPANTDLRNVLQPGDVVVWDHVQAGNAAGHAAVIKEVYKDKVILAESAWGYADGVNASGVSYKGNYKSPRVDRSLSRETLVEKGLYILGQ